MTKVNSTARTRTRKPRNRQSAKPHKDFPLTAHPSGRWCKKVKGKLHYFGKIVENDGGASAQAALDKWLNEKDDLLAGRVPRARQAASGPALHELVNRFLTTKKTLLDAGDLSRFTWKEYHNICEQLVEAFGRERLLSDILPEDFEQLRAKWAKTYGPVRLGAEVNRARVVFNYAWKNGMIPAPIRFGEGFKRPSKKALRLNRAEQGKKLFGADELRQLITAAAQPLKAMLLLGINAGLGNSDIGNMRMKTLDLDAAWLEYPRPKTGINRRCPLWPETTAALREWLAIRPKPKTDDVADLVFLTFRGKSWTPNVRSRPITNEVGELLRRPRCPVCGAINTRDRKQCECGWQPAPNEPWKMMYRPGLSFYALRHTFETIGGASLDQVAVNAIMGHESDDMAGQYREEIGDDRLQAVADHIRNWLFPMPTPVLKIVDESAGAAAVSA